MQQIIPFLMAGDPNLQATQSLAEFFYLEGIRLIEIGVPYSDPLADGPVLQRAAARALRQRTSLESVFSLCRNIKDRCPDLQIVLFSYLNPLLQPDLAGNLRKARASGVTATLLVDLPLEEASEIRSGHLEYGLGQVFLAAPTTSLARCRAIAKASSPFVYSVSRPGVTGKSALESFQAGDMLVELRKWNRLAVGFGLSSPEDVRKVLMHADAAIVGSHFSRIIEGSQDLEEAKRKIHDFLSACLKDSTETVEV